MYIFRLFLAVVVICLAPISASAQSAVWVQIEAQPTLREAQERAQAYASRLEDVAGYAIGRGWYGIVLGPYTRPDAENLLRQLRSAREIPGDSFIAEGRNFRQQFWPVGVGAATTAQPLPETLVTPSDPIPTAPEVVVPSAPIATADETVREARDSEAALARPERELLQTALKWAGFYDAAIDGAFGRGTRNSMAEWQIANNFEPTGVLTTLQRAKLIADYNSVLEGMDLQLVRDDASGIEILIPSGVVAFTEYEPPFARFAAKGDLDVQVLLISQEGDQDRFFGLYEILQTLAIIPPEGERRRRDTSFEIEGVGDGIHSYTTARLENGQIKGFSLIWPAGDENRRTRVLEEMQASFRTIPGVLDPALVKPDDNQAIDLVSGLQVRKPQKSRSGFFIDGQGDVLTTTDLIGDCSRMTINEVYDADVVHVDLARGLAVLRPVAALAPSGVAQFQTGVPRLQAEIAVAGYPYGGVLSTPSLTFGKLADIRGLNGEEEVKRLSLIVQKGDAGGPVLDNGGAVLGMLLPRETVNGQQLPEEVNFSVDASEIVNSLRDAGLNMQTTDSVAFLPSQSLSQQATNVTVLVSCW